MPPPADAVYDAAAAVLSAIEGYYADQAVDLPARRYVSDGRPEWDCEQLIVWVETVSTGSVAIPSIGILDCYHERFAVIGVSLVRCTNNKLEQSGRSSTPKFPTPAAVEESAAVVLADAVLVENAVLVAWQDGDFGENGVALLDWTSRGPAGGLSGGEFRLRFGLSHPLPVAGS